MTSLPILTLLLLLPTMGLRAEEAIDDSTPARPIASTRLSPSAAKPPPQVKPNPSQDADDASDVPMPTPPVICGDRSAVSGGAQMGQDATFASMETAIGRYQHKLYLGIGSRWNLKVQQTMAKIGANRVVISFFVNPDGSISQIHIVEGDPNSILGQISGDAINQSSSLIGPFPDALLVRHPKGFPWQLAFRIK